LANPKASDGVTQRDDFGDAFMAERERSFCSDQAESQKAVDVAARDCERPHDRLLSAIDARLWNVLPDELAWLHTR
jgi:hypothetical protein